MGQIKIGITQAHFIKIDDRQATIDQHMLVMKILVDRRLRLEMEMGGGLKQIGDQVISTGKEGRIALPDQPGPFL